MTLDQLRAGGIDFPAVVIGELELNGYVIERVHKSTASHSWPAPSAKSRSILTVSRPRI